jgi:hypothetical protein
MIYENEVWKDVAGYSGLYQISNLGRVKSTEKLHRIGNGAYQPRPERIRVPRLNTDGYYKLMLSKDGVKKMYAIHRLIAMAFIPNPESKPCINHKNGVKTDNRIENLEWCTYSENNFHKYRVLGYKDVKPVGKDHWKSMPVARLNEHGETIETFDSITDAARKYGLSLGNLSRACKGIYKTSGGFKWKILNEITHAA